VEIISEKLGRPVELYLGKKKYWLIVAGKEESFVDDVQLSCASAWFDGNGVESEAYFSLAAEKSRLKRL